MLAVIPVSSHDASLIDPFSKALRAQGPNPLHDALIVVRPSDEEHARTLFEKIDGLFNKVEVFVLGTDGQSGWPQGPNHYWSSAAHRIQTSPTPQPWLWLELDSTPLKPGWLDAISTEYNLAKTPFMGTICKTHAVNNDGDPVEAGKHLVGVAVYPPRLGEFSQLYVFVPRMDKPFDVLCQYEFVPQTHDTKLIQHCFRTAGYKRDGQEIKGTDNNKFPNGIRFDQPLSPDAVLHHGCIDGSLSVLLTETDVATIKKASIPAPAQEATISAGLDPDVLTPRRKVKIPT